MANDISLTGLTEILYKARDQVCREPAAFAQGVMVNGGSEGVSSGGTVTSLRTTEPTLETSYTPAMTVPDAADITTAVESLTLSSYAGASIALKGEQFLQLVNTVGYEMALQQLYSQSIRKMVNAIESAIATAAYKGASRAVGTAGTTPFASNFNTVNELRQILQDNGTPMDDGMLSLIINTNAGTKLRNLSTLTKVNEAGSDATLRRGELLNISGISIRESAGVASHTKGTGSGYLINNGNVAVGSTALTLDTGSGTIVAGDILTHASDTVNKYVVGTALAANVVTLNRPGLRIATANNDAVTVGDSYTANVGFHKSAIELAMRPPAQPPGGDAGEEIGVLVDEKTGLSFSARLYKGYGVNQIKLMAFYGIKVWKPEFVATLLG
jgi:P22 coat protein - gene protein 5